MKTVIKGEENLSKITEKVLSSTKTEPLILALHGELGAGKTTFVRALARELGIMEAITSPTYLLIKTYDLPENAEDFKKLIHIDAYRIDDPSELTSLGIAEILEDENNIVAIEWAERIKDELPKETTHITFEITGERERGVTINAR